MPDDFRRKVIRPCKTEYTTRCFAHRSSISSYDICFHPLNFLVVYPWLTYAVSAPTSYVRRTTTRMLRVPDPTDIVRRPPSAMISLHRTAPNRVFRKS